MKNDSERVRILRVGLLVLLAVFAMCGAGAAQTFTVLANFNGSNGSRPCCGSLAIDSQGNLWGATGYGSNESTVNQSTIFKMTQTGILTTVYTFGSTPGDSVQPYTPPIVGADGNLYGTTAGEYFGTPGIVYRLTPSGTLTVLHTFDNSYGGYANIPASPLTQGTDGNFYGITSNYQYGTVFKITPDGIFTNLYTFSGPDGRTPWGGLVQGADGYFYGTTAYGGTYDGGTIFRISSTGDFASLYSFGANEGVLTGALIQARDGNFYGTTQLGGTSGNGTIFMMTPQGIVATLYSFAGTDGHGPAGPLMQASDGNFYGTTPLGGQYGCGVIFQMTPAGTVTVLHHFTSADGSINEGGLVQHPNGQLYGFQRDGGLYGDGTVFTITLGGPIVYLSAPSVSFGNQLLGSTSATMTVALTNAGNPTLNIASINLNGNFFALDTTPTSCPYTGGTLAVGATCTIDVTFAPVGHAGLGAQMGSISITDNAAGSPQSIGLSGAGIDTVAPAISISANPSTLWPPNGKSVPVTVTGAITDSGSGVNPSTLACNVVDEYGLVQPGCSVGPLRTGGAYSFTVSLVASRDGSDKNGRTYTIWVRGSDYAGNSTSIATTVIVPHDQGH